MYHKAQPLRGEGRGILAFTPPHQASHLYVHVYKAYGKQQHTCKIYVHDVVQHSGLFPGIHCYSKRMSHSNSRVSGDNHLLDRAHDMCHRGIHLPLHSREQQRQKHHRKQEHTIYAVECLAPHKKHEEHHGERQHKR